MTDFDPLVQRWFAETLGAPTLAQQKGWAAIREHRHTLIAAPTGSGKTLGAFLTALDELVRESRQSPLPDEVRVLYVSPLKALSADIHKNLAEPRRGIRRLAEAEGLQAPRITAAVRTGDTTASERAAMLRRPPHLLVTTPESLYLLLTSDRSRQMLGSVRTVIVDEIHAVIGTRRGAHLALSLERLQQVASRRFLRIGLSATQKPVDEVARFLIGADPDRGECTIVDEGHRRALDLDVEIPRSALDAVMAHEVWEEYYDRLTELVLSHKTTLVFVNTRRMAERVARHLSDRLGEDAVTAHHGSLSKETRLDAENRLKNGALKALVATASLELGIDIGHVDLVCQIGSPHRIATLLQRVGRSGHTIAGLPKGRMLPTSRDDLLECAAILAAVRSGDLDRIASYDAPLDVLAQQVTAEASCREYGEDELFTLFRQAAPYRALARRDFDAVVAMLSLGFATRRGRRAALVHRDEVHRTLRGRRGSRMLAVTSGGAIPEVADYRVVLAPDDTFVGTLNEDFAIESMAGDVFQLGNTSWRVLQVAAGVVRVADAEGAPPNIPFWLGEAPARSDELSKAVSDLRAEIARLLEVADPGPRGEPSHAGEPADAREPRHANELSRITSGGVRSDDDPSHDDPSYDDPSYVVSGFSRTTSGGVRSDDDPSYDGPSYVVSGFSRTTSGGVRSDDDPSYDDPSYVVSGFSRTTVDREDPSAGAAEAVRWLEAATGIGRGGAEQIVAYIADGRRALGAVPTQETLVLERFFDESGGMQLVLHAPFGSRVNRAWALALRKRFCRQFNFELQAAANEDALLLSLGPQHSFPLADVFRYLHPATVRDILVQAFLDAPMFQTRWRWNATISLAVPRNRSGRKVPPQLQRMQADDLMAAVFPDAAACLENIPGDREVPDHPLVNQTVRDCLEEAMDLPRLTELLARIHEGTLHCVSRDTPEPSSFSHEILNARPYAFLDDAPLEERRAQAVQTRRATGSRAGLDRMESDAGVLDADAIARVRDEARPDPRDIHELHDALLTYGFLFEHESDAAWFDDLGKSGRAVSAHLPYVVSGFSRTPDAASSSGRTTSPLWVAAERLPEMAAVHPTTVFTPAAAVPPARAARAWTREDALVELLRSRLMMTGPTTAAALAEALALPVSAIDSALLALEADGAVLRGRFSPAAATAPPAIRPATMETTATGLEWCDRRLLARIHRYTLNRLRAEIAPVTAAEFMRFLFLWQHADPAARLQGPDGLRAVVRQLDGLELPARAWEQHVLPARVERYEPGMLDALCLTGEVGWARVSAGPTEVVGATPIALFLREHAGAWSALHRASPGDPSRSNDAARAVLDRLIANGASFAYELAAACGLDESELRSALGALVAAGLVSSDGYAGLRSLANGAARGSPHRVESAGRWFALRGGGAGSGAGLGWGSSDGALHGSSRATDRNAVELLADTLLRRYGVVFRRLLSREAAGVPWREIAQIYRRREARGEIRGGRFVTGMSGEQFARPEAVERLREVRRKGADDRLMTISGADPLNLTGIVTPGDRVRVSAATRIVYRNGVPLAALEGDMLRTLAPVEPAIAADVAAAAAGRRVPVVSGYVGRMG